MQVTNRVMVRWCTSCVILTCLGGEVVESATYYVRKEGSDSHSCSEAQTNTDSAAKGTIQGGLDCLSKDSSGHEVVVGAGTYRESVQIHSSSRGDSWSNPNVLRAGSGETVWIVDAQNPLSVTDHIAPRDGGGTRPNQYWIIERLRLSCEGGQGTALGSDNNPHMRYVSIEMTACRRGFVGGGDYNEWINLHPHHLGVGGCPSDGGRQTDCYGMYFGGSESLIDGGSWHDIPLFCAHIYNGGYTNRNVTVRNAKFCRCGTGVGAYNTGHHILNNTFVGNETDIATSHSIEISGNTFGASGDVCTYDDSGPGPVTPPPPAGGTLPTPRNFRVERR